jgi:hypothetical protein
MTAPVLVERTMPRLVSEANSRPEGANNLFARRSMSRGQRVKRVTAR